MKRFLRSIIWGVLTAFLVTGIVPPVAAQELFLPVPTKMVGLSQPFAPCLLKGIRLNAKDPFHLDFIVDEGKSGVQGDVTICIVQSIENHGGRTIPSSQETDISV